MPSTRSKPPIDRVIYSFKKNDALQIDVVPIAERLLTDVNKERTTAPHRTDFYRIIWFQRGNPIHTVDFEKIAIQSPALLFVHKDKLHLFDRETDHDGKVLIFKDDFFLRTEANSKFLKSSRLFNDARKPVLLQHVDTHLKRIFESIESEIQAGARPYKSELLYHLLNSFLYLAERLAATQSGDFPQTSSVLTLVNAFMDLVEFHYKKRLSIEKYAEMLHITVGKLNIATQEVSGKTGKTILTERVMLEAKRLLAYSHFKIKEVAFELGFDQPTNFIKFFHAHSGMTPAEFKKSIR